MKKIYYSYSLIACVVLFLVGCAEMNDKHDEFLARGETVYIGKVDSVQAFPGDGRLLLKYWLSDPRAKSVTVYWGTNDSKSKALTVAQHAQGEALEVILGTADGLTEGNHTFHWISSDIHENKSMVHESFASVYGDLYRSNLLNRRVVQTVPADNGDVDITLAGASSSEEIGVELFYTQLDGTEVTQYEPQLGTSLSLLSVDYTKGVRYRTWYKPTLTAIDSFCTETVKMDIIKTVNVTLNKPTLSVNAYWDGGLYAQPHLVDGITVDGNRWVVVVDAVIPNPWIEIDLLGTYTISSFKTWSGQNANYSWPTARFDLQAWIDGSWVTVHSVTSNTNPTYGNSFPPVETTKVRFYAYGDVRWFEAAVYSLIRY
ncbi:hypothetical protein FACS1894199_17760 [Bacteroidia bacterium]|nr:hypothetical protein FACS1894199_17760 [Bacteroidia bacterium]